MDDFATGYALGQDSNGGNGGCNGWADIIWPFMIFAMMCGGYGGWGGGFGGNAGGTVLTESAMQRGFDTQSIINKLNGLENGLCDGFYAMNTGLLNGFNGNQMAVNTAATNLQTAMTAGFTGVTAGQTAIANQIASCCCENKQLIGDLRYNLAEQSCATRQAIADATRDIVDNANANYRGIIDFMTQDKIASLQAENQTLKFAASQADQNAWLKGQLDASRMAIIQAVNPPPIPAYTVPAPYPYCYNNNGCGGCA